MRIRIVHDLVYAPCALICECNDGRDLLIQTDWDYPGFASTFGWSPCVGCDCRCEGTTDGTVDCDKRTAGDMIQEAYEYLLEHEGEWVDDPGYFD